MINRPTKHHRRSIRLNNYDYTLPGAYFLTIVTYQRQCIFGKIQENCVELSKIGLIAHREWSRIPHRFPNISLDSFIIMPNHIHGILMIHEGRGTAEGAPNQGPFSSRCAPTQFERFGKPIPGSIPTIVRSYKSAVALRVNRLRNTPAAPVWQRNYYERVIRHECELEQIRKYIIENPFRWDEDNENPI